VKLPISLVCALILWSTATAFAATDAEVGAAKATVCSGCHGPDGISVNALWPNLAGQHVEYLEKQIKAFRDGTRVEPMMQPFVATLSDADVVEIATLYASRKACK